MFPENAPRPIPTTSPTAPREVRCNDLSYAGLTRVSINLEKSLAKKMDGRVEPTGVRHDSCFMRPCPWRGWPEHLDAAALRVLLLARSRGWAVAALALAWSGEAQQSIGGASSLSG